MTPIPKPDKPIISPQSRSGKHAKTSKKSYLSSVMLAMAVIGFGGFGLTKWVDGVGFPFAGGGDSLSDREIQARADNMDKINRLDVQVYDAEQSMQILPNIPSMNGALLSDMMAQASEYGNIRVAEITMWDDLDQDGDVVQFASLGTIQTVNLTNAPQTIYVPIKVGQPAKLAGINDGGGGITLAFMSSGQPVSSPVLSPGDIIEIDLF
ncbi:MULTISPECIES: hypothetical protein [Moraxella]|jgi:hypothetical protein|uniref:Uncharacterized protein n=1 Tax=Moraxella lacunata TaxID=477 RepID=A0A1B8PW29_MORLA|nr:MULTISPECIES: hypothetical protein [Moraxella]MBE9579708.1 hypothetical protein [Moraxella sp. K1664]MBE9589019.1 hypothetical protein [Moraxella sp. K1630]MBE9597283.1 hypothetical protein [Moraxella sp. K2450]MDH9219758.1 hypothetical protein [Moraxella lacunata]MDI4483014.1 hypothetical protein [Moraxella lacunata]